MLWYNFDMNTRYYDGTKLLSMKDLDGNIPEIYISTSNRTGGKTTFFNRMVVNRVLKKRRKFMVLYRFKYELEDCSTAFFKDLQGLFFKDYEMTHRILGKGAYAELYLNDICCGYAAAMNSANFIKKRSHLFNDVSSITVDEFQAEDGVYAQDEVQKLISIHTSVARGNGEMVRYVPVYLIGNLVDILNPYYIQLGIYRKLDIKTNYLRGHGYVLEQNYNESAGEAQSSSGFNKAFMDSDYYTTLVGKNYLYGDDNFITNMHGRSKYICTLIYEGKHYGIREYESGIVYCNERPDMNCPEKISVLCKDHNEGYVYMRPSAVALFYLRRNFDNGNMRFQTRKCKEVILDAVAFMK